MSPMRLKKLHSNESGMALVTALLILVALTLLAVTAMTNTTINTMIAGNDYKSQQKFYAAEGAEELALAALPDLISGKNDDVMRMGIKDLDSILSYDSDGDNIADGNINKILNAYLNLKKEDFFSKYCTASSNDPLTYAVRIQDYKNDDTDPDNNDPSDDNDTLTDSNNKVDLIVSQTDPSQIDPMTKRPKTTDLISYTLWRLLIKHDGAVNLIDKDGGVSITMQANSLVDGGINKVGIITTDNLWKDFSHLDDNDLNNGEVDPNGVVQRFNQFVNPSIKDLHDVMSLLTNYRNRTPLKEGDPISLGTSDVAANPSSTIYVRGDVTITNNMSNKVLIIGDYYDSVTTRYQIGLHLETGVTFNGLILLLPDHDVGSSAIPITLSNGAQINGAIIASSYYYDPYDPNYDPNNPLPKSGPGIDLTLNNNAEIIYDYSKIVSTGFERQFAVLKREYLSH